MYSEICSLHLTHPWGAVGSHGAAPGDQLQTLSQFIGQGFWLEINLLMVETRAPEHANTERTCKLHIERTILAMSAVSAVLTTMPPWE